MIVKKKSYILISRILLVIFFLPMLTFGLHSFCDHNHEICKSKNEIHIHDKDIDCNLHLLKQANSDIVTFNFKVFNHQEIDSLEVLKINLLPKDNSLSFLLRGPPSFVRI